MNSGQVTHAIQSPAHSTQACSTLALATVPSTYHRAYSVLTCPPNLVMNLSRAHGSQHAAHTTVSGAAHT